MAKSYNKVTLMGRFTADPEIRNKQDGTAIARWSLAVDRDKEGTDFPRINAFGKLAETVEKYLRKGSLVLVEGKVRTGSYDDKDGKKVYTTDIMADKVVFLDSKQEEAQTGVSSAVKIDEFVDYLPDEEFPFV